MIVEEDGFRIHVKEDGTDYLDVYRRLRRGEIPVKNLLFDDAEHFVQLVETGGRTYVFKRFGELDGKIDTKLWRAVAGPYYSHLMRLVNRAVAAGCTVVPDMYLVAERMRGRLALDNYLLLEFVPGTPMDKVPDFAAHGDAIAAAFAEMHRHGLSLGHVKPGNLVLGDDGRVRFIDLSSRGTQWMGRGKDAVKAKRLWNLDIPLTRPHDALARLYAIAQLDITRLRRYVKARLGLKKYY